jgi:hypothetical protein
MKIIKCLIFLFVISLVAITLGAFNGICAKTEGTLEWKNYVIRMDRGWDILCEPYEVQPDDWVLKIFEKKGEIAHQNFREFLGIFERLNPHVKDIDRIRPGQIIDIPLKKLTQGTLQGQSSGIVTIPFVTLNSVDEILNDYSTEYTIQTGDCVSVIVARRFGIYGSNSYSKGLKMFQALNPQIKDMDRIITGQKIHVPAPTIQKQAWYNSMFDSQGNLTDKIGMPQTRSTPDIPVGKKDSPLSSDQQPQHQMKDALSQAAAALEGTLLNKGTYYLPLNSGRDFELDLSSFPILERKNGKRYLLTHQNKIMGEDIELLRTMLTTDITIVKLTSKQTTDQVIDAVIKDRKSKDDMAATGISFSEHGAEIRLKAKWIETVESKGDDIPRRICIMPIKSSDERTAAPISRYLLQHNIVLKEVLTNTGGVISADSSATDIVDRYSIVTSISTSDKKEFVKEFADALKWRFTPNVNISFPYADVQVNALSNLLTTGRGQELLIDFEDLYGEAIDAIKKTGLNVVQIRKDDSPTTITTKLFTGMHSAFTVNPTFMAAKRHSLFNTTIRINGFLLNRQNSENILLATNSLNQKVVEFIESTGSRVIMLGQSKLFY